MSLEYRGYVLACVIDTLDPATREDIVQMWLRERVLDETEARRRAAEVAFTVRDAAGQLAGVDTVYIDDLLQPGNPYYYLRMFLRPAHRGVPGLRQFLSRATRRHLRDTPALAARARGVVIVTENHKFHEPGARRSLERNGWTYLGRNAQGHDVWFDNFDGSTHPLPAAAATNPTPPLY